MDLDTLKSHVDGYLQDSEEARINAERRRDYIDNKQWTEEEASVMRGRQQQAIVHNRLAPKVDGLKGLLIQRRTDPKAFPRTQAHEDAAQAATDGLRYVADNTKFDDTKLAVADDYFVEGVGGAIVRMKEKDGRPEDIDIVRVPWDRIYYDIRSREDNFSDATYMGIITWKDHADAEREHDTTIELAGEGEYGETFDDRPQWVVGDDDRKRIRIAEEYFLEDGVWMMATFTCFGFIHEPEKVPFLDEDGNPMNPMELVSCHTDRENNRFGDVEYWMDSQDAINHRLSKYQHLMTTRQMLARAGVFSDVDAAKREFKKADGWIEYEGEKGDVEVLSTQDMAQAQLAMLEFSSSHIDAVGFNAQLAGERQGNLSGKAINLLSNAGTNELASSFSKLVAWENRIYRQVWQRIVQYWAREKWVRVTDEERKLRWVGFNVKVPLQQYMEEIINDEAKPEFDRKEVAKIYAPMMKAEDPRLKEPFETRNSVAELDMDIILEQSLDTINIQQEQFTMLATLAGNRPEIPFTALLRLSTLRDKDELIKKIEEGEQNAGALAQQAAEAEVKVAAAKEEITTAGELKKIEAEAMKDLMVTKARTESQEKIAAVNIMAKEREVKADKELVTHTSETKGEKLRKREEVNARLAESNEQLAQVKAMEGAAIEALIAELSRPLTVTRDENGMINGIV